MSRPDYCPVGNEPCQSMCEEPCSWTPKTKAGKLQAALDLLAGLHPGLTVDDPMEAAQRIFDHVQAEQAEHRRERENDRLNIAARDSLIRRLRAQAKEGGKHA
ncbi:hypothetical protein [Ottowia sp. VDI28]|uniref:hypothetical protein n=1 Tax=Ottowia sp. VDI28 TaxID=3133968 RepID=UPI003C2F79CF